MQDCFCLGLARVRRGMVLAVVAAFVAGIAAGVSAQPQLPDYTAGDTPPGDGPRLVWSGWVFGVGWLVGHAVSVGTQPLNREAYRFESRMLSMSSVWLSDSLAVISALDGT